MSVDWSNVPEGAADVRKCAFGNDFFTNGKDLYHDNGVWLEMSFKKHSWPVVALLKEAGRPAEANHAKCETAAGFDAIRESASDLKLKDAGDFLSAGMTILCERGQQYGSNSRECSFPQVAEAFNAITGNELSGSDVCMILTLLKLVRQSAQPDRLHVDSLVDGVNYMALYAEMISKELNK